MEFDGIVMDVKLDPGAIQPTRAHDLDAGLDLFTPVEVTIGPLEFGVVDTGVHIVVPRGLVGFVKSKSGLMTKNGILTDGTVDAGYTGSYRVALFNLTSKPVTFKAGDKIAQVVFVPFYKPTLKLVDHLPETERGANGFGSTGR